MLFLERFNQSLTDKLFKNLSNTIEKRSFNYVNRYVKTNMQIASIVFDRKRQQGGLEFTVISIFLIFNKINFDALCFDK